MAFLDQFSQGQPAAVEEESPPGQSPEGVKPTRVEQMLSKMPEPVARLVVAAGKTFYQKEFSDAAMQQFQEGDPAEVLARIVTAIMGDLAQKAQGNFPREHIPAAVMYVMKMVADYAEDAGVFESNERVQKMVDDYLSKLPEEQRVDASKHPTKAEIVMLAALRPVIQGVAKVFKATPQEMQALAKSFGAQKAPEQAAPQGAM